MTVVTLSPLAEFDDMMTEAEICKRYCHLLSDRELREARRNGQISFGRGKRGLVVYRPAWIADYLNRKIIPCQPQQNGSGNTEAIGSVALPAPNISTPVGGTSESDERVAEVLRQKFSRKLRSV